MRYIWATAEYSMFEITDALNELRVSYSYRDQHLIQTVNNRHAQPKWVHVTGEVKHIRRNSINFVVASYAELDLTNYPRFTKSGDLYVQMKDLLTNPVKCDPEVRKMTVMDYVNMVCKPSLLNNIQTMVYKIQPYSLRKETQQLVLDYFCSRVSAKKTFFILMRSFKTAGLIPLLKNGVVLRDAVAQLKTQSVEAVSAETGVPTFDLLYLTRAGKKT